MKPSRYAWVLLGLILFFGSSSLLWLSRNTRPPGPDTAAEIRTALEFSRPLSQLSAHGFRDIFLSHTGVPYPPLHFILTAVQFALTKPSIDWAAAANVAWMVIFSLAAYAIGVRFFSPAVGLLTIALTWSMTIVAAFVREVSLEIALMATVTASIYFLLRSEHFTEWKSILGLGLTAGAGLLVKESFPIYLFSPALFVLLRKPSKISVKVLTGCLAGASLAVALAALWYVPHWADVRALYAFNQQQAVIEKDPIGWNLAAALFYPNALVNYYLQPLFAVILIAALFQNWWRLNVAKQTMLIWLAGGYFLLTFIIANKDVRHFIPCAPVMGFLVADWLLSRTTIMRRVLVSLTLAVSTVFFFASQWGAPRNGSVVFSRAAHYNWKVWDGALFSETIPHQENWNIPPLIRTVAQDAAQRDSTSPPRIAVVPFVYRFNNQTLQCYAALQNFSAEFISVGNEPDPTILRSFDYVITKTGDQGAAALTTEAAAMNRFLKSPLSPFTPLSSFSLFDGSNAVVLKKSEHPGQEH